MNSVNSIGIQLNQCNQLNHILLACLLSYTMKKTILSWCNIDRQNLYNSYARQWSKKYKKCQL